MCCKALFLAVLCVLCVDCYKILGVFHPAAKSHYIVGNALMKGLAEAGHQVTILTAFKEKNPIKNYEEIFLEHSLSDAMSETRNGNFLNFNNLHFWDIAQVTYDVSFNFTRSAIRSDNFQQFLREDRHFDVVIAEVFVGDALLALAQYYNAPLIAFSTTVPSKWSSDLVGLSHFTSHIPNILCGFTGKMNFWQRTYNSLAYWYEDIMTELYHKPAQQKLLESFWPNKTNVPNFDDVLRNVALVFVNSHVTYATPQPLAANLIEIGGIHINQSDHSKTVDVQHFLNEAKDGAIFFSLGSNIKLSEIPQNVKTIIANSFAEFPNVRILIKNEEDFVISSHQKSDVLTKSWFNQQEILSHPNLKLFITHGGTIEISMSNIFNDFQRCCSS